MYQRRTDNNHQEIMDAFRGVGCTVADTSSLGKGFPDLVVGFMGLNCLVEVKDGTKPPSKRTLTRHELSFRGGWLGWYEIVTSVDEAVALSTEMYRRGIDYAKSRKTQQKQ